MLGMRDSRKKMIGVAVTAAGVCLVTYFAFYTIAGDRGLRTMTELQGQITVADARLNTLQIARAALQAKVTRLRPESIDPDLLDERARAVLNFGKPNDLIIRERTH